MGMSKATDPVLSRVIEIFGSQTKLATALGLRQQTVNEAVRRGGPAPAKWCLKIEEATDGKVTRHELRPDLYPMGRA